MTVTMILKIIYIIYILKSGCCFVELTPQIDVQEHDWNAVAQRYPNLSQVPSFISHHRDSVIQHSINIADINKLQEKQLLAYRIVKQHFESNCDAPLRIIISGTAGTGKSYLI